MDKNSISTSLEFSLQISAQTNSAADFTVAFGSNSAKSEDDQQWDQKVYDSHIEQRRRADDKALEVSGRYSKWLLTIGGGALFTSLTFIEKIAPHPFLASLWGLFVGWAALIFSLVSGFLSIYSSPKSIYRQIEILDAEYQKYEKSKSSDKDAIPSNASKTESLKNKYSDRINRCNRLSAILLVIGLACVSIFAGINIYYKTEQENQHVNQPVAVKAQEEAKEAYNPKRSQKSGDQKGSSEEKDLKKGKSS